MHRSPKNENQPGMTHLYPTAKTPARPTRGRGPKPPPPSGCGRRSNAVFLCCSGLPFSRRRGVPNNVNGKNGRRGQVLAQSGARTPVVRRPFSSASEGGTVRRAAGRAADCGTACSASRTGRSRTHLRLTGKRPPRGGVAASRSQGTFGGGTQAPFFSARVPLEPAPRPVERRVPRLPRVLVERRNAVFGKRPSGFRIRHKPLVETTLRGMGDRPFFCGSARPAADRGVRNAVFRGAAGPMSNTFNSKRENGVTRRVPPQVV